MSRFKIVRVRTSLFFTISLVVSALAIATELDSYEDIAAKLNRAACTVRIIPESLANKSRLDSGHLANNENDKLAQKEAVAKPITLDRDVAATTAPSAPVTQLQISPTPNGSEKEIVTDEWRFQRELSESDNRTRGRNSAARRKMPVQAEAEIPVTPTEQNNKKLELPPTNESITKDANGLNPTSGEIVICSGVALPNGLFVTVNPEGRPVTSALEFRITLPGGARTIATPRVWDQYTDLILLESAEKTSPGLQIASDAIAAGATVLVASGSGIELPAVSVGIVSAVDRLMGNHSPPLLQCDVHTTESSSGAPLVNRKGELVGIVIHTQQSPERGDWTYALPSRHIVRMLNIIQKEALVVIPRRRPVAGVELEPGDEEGFVKVGRVAPEGPAAKAGLQVGDRVLAVDNKQIRVPYQAVEMIMSRQPGDNLSFTVDRQGKSTLLNVDLADDNGLTTDSLTRSEKQITNVNQSLNFSPQYKNSMSQNRGSRVLRQTSDNSIELRNGGQVAELEEATVSPPPAAAAAPAAAARAPGTRLFHSGAEPSMQNSANTGSLSSNIGGSSVATPPSSTTGKLAESNQPSAGFGFAGGNARSLDATSVQVISGQSGTYAGAPVQLKMGGSFGDAQSIADKTATLAAQQSATREQLASLEQKVKELEQLVESLRAELRSKTLAQDPSTSPDAVKK